MVESVEIGPPALRDGVLVGVDDSTHCAAALSWAAAESDRTGLPLDILYMVGTPRGAGDDPESLYRRGASVLDYARWQVLQDHPDVEIAVHVAAGSGTEGLVWGSRESAMVVVGRRTVDGFAAVRGNATSGTLSAVSATPTIVVPETWQLDPTGSGRIVVGLDIGEAAPAALRFGCRRATELGVDLQVVYAWDLHPSTLLTDQDRTTLGGEAQNALDTIVQPYRERFRDIEIETVERYGSPAHEVLSAAHSAELIVIGQRSASHGPATWTDGWFTRRVLSHAVAPLAVIPRSEPPATPTGMGRHYVASDVSQ